MTTVSGFHKSPSFDPKQIHINLVQDDETYIQIVIKGEVCQTQLFISELQRHVSAYLEAIIRLQI